MRWSDVFLQGGSQSSDKNYISWQFSDNTYISQFSDKKMETLQFSDSIEKKTAIGGCWSE